MQTGWTASAASAEIGNSINNLPAGLIAHAMLTSGRPIPGSFGNALLLGIDLGPQQSITGSCNPTLAGRFAQRRTQDQPLGFSRVGLIVATPATGSARHVSWPPLGSAVIQRYCTKNTALWKEARGN